MKWSFILLLYTRIRQTLLLYGKACTVYNGQWACWHGLGEPLGLKIGPFPTYGTASGLGPTTADWQLGVSSAAGTQLLSISTGGAAQGSTTARTVDGSFQAAC